MSRPLDDHGGGGWVGPLLAVLVAQIAVTFLSRLAPTLAPALSASLGWQVTDIGLLSSVMAGGSTVFMLVGLPLILRAGPVRSLQAGLVVGAAGTLMYAIPTSSAVLIGSVLIGLGTGPQSTAGSDVLQRHAPTLHYNLVFSIKQAGVPLAGVLAGLALPGLAASLGLSATFVVCAGLAVAALLVIQPLQRRLDMHRDLDQRIDARALLSLDNLRRPLRTVADNADLRRVALAGTFLVFGQGAWFTFLISFLVVYRGMSLAAAGALFALMQVVSAVGRPFLGWLADRLTAYTVMQASCVMSALTTATIAFVTPQWPQWAVVALIVVAGATVSSWNGVQGAQTVQYARPGAVSESVLGSSLMIFLSNILVPVLFGAIAALGGDLRMGFGLAAVITLGAWVPMAQLQRSHPAP